MLPLSFPHSIPFSSPPRLQGFNFWRESEEDPVDGHEMVVDTKMLKVALKDKPENYQ